MAKKERKRGEFLQGETDVPIHMALLGSDDQFTFDPMDPKQVAKRKAEEQRWADEARRSTRRSKP